MGAARLFLALVVASNHWNFQVLVPRQRPWSDHLVLGFNAGYAVMFFYVISGFLITYTLSRNYEPTPAGAGRFYRNRFIRIFSLYWPLVLVAFVTFDQAWPIFLSSGIVDKFTGLFLFGIDWRLMFATYPPERWDGAIRGLYQAWTLGAELTFYLLAPLLVRWWKAAAVLLLLSAALRAALVATVPNTMAVDYWLYLFAPATFLFFMFGLLSCLAARRFPAMLRRGWWLGFLAASLVAMEVLPHWPWFDTPRFWLSILCFALAVPGLFDATKGMRWLNRLGDLSYPVYLVHNLVLPLVAAPIAALFLEPYRARWLTSLISCAAFSVAVIVAAAAAHLLLERPTAALMRAAFSGLRGRTKGIPATAPATGGQ